MRRLFLAGEAYWQSGNFICSVLSGGPCAFAREGPHRCSAVKDMQQSRVDLPGGLRTRDV